MSFSLTWSGALPFTVPAGSPLSTSLPTLHNAVKAFSDAATAQWVAYANGAELPDGRALPAWMQGGEYARSIINTASGALSYTIEARSQNAGRIEDGWPAYDMKRALQTSLKTRISKKGFRYLIIPFRHFTPSATTQKNIMPDFIHEVAHQLRASRVIGDLHKPNELGVHDIKTRLPTLVRRRQYAWGDRLPGGLASKAKDHHKTDLYSGMVRFDAPHGGHSRYLTFRTMSENSSGWIRKAIPGYRIAGQLAVQLQPAFEKVCQEAFAADIKALSGGA